MAKLEVRPCLLAGLRLRCAVAGLAFAACVTPGSSSIDYTKPQTRPIENRALVDDAFPVVWDRYVRRLSEGFFVINNIEKASRIINVSLSSSDASGYVDCGRTERSFAFRGQSEVYRYEVADPSTYKIASSWGPGNLPVVATMHRRPSLDGRVNVFLAPAGDGASEVVVNVRYVVTLSSSGQAIGMDAYGTVVSREPVSDPDPPKITFNTGKPGTYVGTDRDGKPIELMCVSTGRLERELLELSAR